MTVVRKCPGSDVNGGQGATVHLLARHGLVSQINCGDLVVLDLLARIQNDS